MLQSNQLLQPTEINTIRLRLPEDRDKNPSLFWTFGLDRQKEQSRTQREARIKHLTGQKHRQRQLYRYTYLTFL